MKRDTPGRSLPAAVSPRRLLAAWMVAAFAACHAWAQQGTTDPMAQRMAACFACHGKEGRATSQGYFPRIAGKPAGYLYNQLINFREGRRRYPLMAYMVRNMSDDYLREIADYFSALHPPYPPPQPVKAAASTLARGQALALSGDVARNLPACSACHGQKLNGVLPAIPGLLGLPQDYLVSQLGAWRTGQRQAAAPDCMARISRELSPEEVGAVAAWLASQPVPDEMRPQAAPEKTLPIDCGGMPRSK